ncbi:54S ribosomal protein L33, mitochondrial [Mycena sanguinolenta]|uniref:Large ribosomal subunit protein uL30m n=1 Tax=Mycena sanguinolenta TaxID=230812 RepID=A0A8H6ZI87_9AGAR|nr:54S ribosomal protein L33, mitochondrial [Mycena sanguinolenta]
MAARICRYSTGPSLSPRLTNLRLISTLPDPSAESSKNTHFKITLRRSAISLGDKKKGTLAALGLHRRNQTVFHPHKPDIAGKILAVKELLEVRNVPALWGREWVVWMESDHFLPGFTEDAC